MIYNAPQPTASTNQDKQSQIQAQKADLTSLSKTDIADAFKAPTLKTYIEKIIKKNEQQGVSTDVSIIDLQTNASIVSHNLDNEQFAASVQKVPVAQLVLNDLRAGRITMDQQITWQATDVRGGEGVFDRPDAPHTATVRELLFDMLNYSGNTAVRAFVNQIFGGAVATNTRFRQELGLQHTYLLPLEGTLFWVGNTTARDAMTNIRRLLSGNDQYQAFVKNALVTNIYTDYGVKSQLAGNDYIVLANKIGVLDDPDGNNRHDVGIIYNTKTNKSYAYAFINTAHGPGYNTATSQASISLADMGRGVLRYAGDKPQTTAQDAPLKLGENAGNAKPIEKRITY